MALGWRRSWSAWVKSAQVWRRRLRQLECICICENIYSATFTIYSIMALNATWLGTTSIILKMY
ncbi:unnamed protein product [Taenia asiatica]|uniref:Uncharacterized protein n=1 Tax=Taenia asiatica TaxID=60517 RepID=A0A0R3W5U3_TAEAS|nr:unnamed protein product [Taenia asiatica]